MESFDEPCMLAFEENSLMDFFLIDGIPSLNSLLLVDCFFLQQGWSLLAYVSSCPLCDALIRWWTWWRGSPTFHGGRWDPWWRWRIAGRWKWWIFEDSVRSEVEKAILRSIPHVYTISFSFLPRSHSYFHFVFNGFYWARVLLFLCILLFFTISLESLDYDTVSINDCKLWRCFGWLNMIELRAWQFKTMSLEVEQSCRLPKMIVHFVLQLFFRPVDAIAQSRVQSFFRLFLNFVVTPVGLNMQGYCFAFAPVGDHTHNNAHYDNREWNSEPQ